MKKQWILQWDLGSPLEKQFKGKARLLGDEKLIGGKLKVANTRSSSRKFSNKESCSNLTGRKTHSNILYRVMLCYALCYLESQWDIYDIKLLIQDCLVSENHRFTGLETVMYDHLLQCITLRQNQPYSISKENPGSKNSPGFVSK